MRLPKLIAVTCAGTGFGEGRTSDVSPASPSSGRSAYDQAEA